MFYNDGEQKSYKTWDNIHWWGGYKDTHIPSAPGAFHALHLHWRWGGAVKGGMLPPTPDYGKEPQFVDSGIPLAIQKDKRYLNFLGPLVHPDCWIQSVRFAIVKHKENDNTTTKEFRDKFASKFNNPALIKDGKDIMLWYSVELNKELILPAYTTEDISRPIGNTRVTVPEKKLSSSLNGTVFIHGLYFAHEKEPTLDPRHIIDSYFLIGSRKEEYFPKGGSEITSEHKFLRDAKF